MNKIGPYIKRARERLELTREQAAKMVGISAGYFGHLERSYPVPLSERVQTNLIKKLKVSIAIKTAAPSHNKKSAILYRKYRLSRAA